MRRWDVPGSVDGIRRGPIVKRLFPIEKHDLKCRLGRLALVKLVLVVGGVRQARLTRTKGGRECLCEVEQHGAGRRRVGRAEELGGSQHGRWERLERIPLRLRHFPRGGIM